VEVFPVLCFEEKLDLIQTIDRLGYRAYNLTAACSDISRLSTKPFGAEDIDVTQAHAFDLHCVPAEMTA